MTRFLVLIYIAIYLHFCDAIKSSQYGRFHRYDVCREAPDSPVKWIYLTFENSNKNYSIINSQCEISRVIKKVRIEAVVNRCAHKDALDTCESYGTIKPLNTCDFIAMKGCTWTTYIRSFTPPFICPFQKGTYTQVNGTFDPNIFQFFPIHGWYWRVKFGIFEGNTFLFEFCTEFSVHKIS